MEARANRALISSIARMNARYGFGAAIAGSVATSAVGRTETARLRAGLLEAFEGVDVLRGIGLVFTHGFFVRPLPRLLFLQPDATRVAARELLELVRQFVKKLPRGLR